MNWGPSSQIPTNLLTLSWSIPCNCKVQLLFVLKYLPYLAHLQCLLLAEIMSGLVFSSHNSVIPEEEKCMEISFLLRIHCHSRTRCERGLEGVSRGCVTLKQQNLEWSKWMCVIYVKWNVMSKCDSENINCIYSMKVNFVWAHYIEQTQIYFILSFYSQSSPSEMVELDCRM